MTVFLDTDVILDILLDRKEFYHSVGLLDYLEKNRIKTVTTTVIFANTFYIVSQAKSKKIARLALQKLRILCSVIETNQKIIDQALASKISDFEDAIQYYAAINNNVTHLITRNVKDYPKKSPTSILTPSEFLATIK